MVWVRHTWPIDTASSVLVNLLHQNRQPSAMGVANVSTTTVVQLVIRTVSFVMYLDLDYSIQ